MTISFNELPWSLCVTYFLDFYSKDAMAMPLGTTMDQCRKICRDDRGMLPFYCKSFHYSDKSKLCLLSEHGPRSKVTNSTDFSYHESICIQGGKDN